MHTSTLVWHSGADLPPDDPAADLPNGRRESIVVLVVKRSGVIDFGFYRTYPDGQGEWRECIGGAAPLGAIRCWALLPDLPLMETEDDYAD